MKNTILDVALWIATCFVCCFGIVLAYCYSKEIDAFFMTYRLETGVVLIVLSFVGLIKFTKYLTNHWMI